MKRPFNKKLPGSERTSRLRKKRRKALEYLWPVPLVGFRQVLAADLLDQAGFVYEYKNVPQGMTLEELLMTDEIKFTLISGSGPTYISTPRENNGN